MIIGNGDVASVLSDNDSLLYFASGVSNSREVRESEYQREVDLLEAQDHNKHIVYFSSICIFYSDGRYAQHKKQMESLVKKFKTYTIIRLGNISWGVNPNTIINYLSNRYKNGEPLLIQDTYRYVVDKEEFLYWIGMIPEWSCEMNVIGNRMTVTDIVKRFVFDGGR